MTEQATTANTPETEENEDTPEFQSPAEELALLKERAVQLGISFYGNIGIQNLGIDHRSPCPALSTWQPVSAVEEVLAARGTTGQVLGGADPEVFDVSRARSSGSRRDRSHGHDPRGRL